MGITLVLPSMNHPSDTECTDTIHDAKKYRKEFQFLEKDELDTGNEIVEALNEIFFMYLIGMDAKDTLIQSAFTKNVLATEKPKRIPYPTKIGESINGMSICPSIGKALLLNPILQIASCTGSNICMLHDIHGRDTLEVAVAASSIHGLYHRFLLARNNNATTFRYTTRRNILQSSINGMALHNLLFSRRESASSMFYSRFQSVVIHKIKEKYAESAIHKNDPAAAAFYILARSKGSLDMLFDTKIFKKISNVIASENTDLGRHLRRTICNLESTSSRVATYIAAHSKSLPKIAELNTSYPFVGKVSHMGIDMSVVYTPVQTPTYLTMIDGEQYKTGENSIDHYILNISNITKASMKDNPSQERLIEMASRSTKLWPSKNLLPKRGEHMDGTHPYPISGGTLVRRPSYEETDNCDTRGCPPSLMKRIATDSVEVPPVFDPNKETEEFDRLVRDMQTIYMWIGYNEVNSIRYGCDIKVAPYFAAIYMSVCTDTRFGQLLDPALICYDLTLTEIYAMIELYSIVCAVDNSFYAPTSALAKDIHQQVMALIRTHNILANNVIQACEKLGIVSNYENVALDIRSVCRRYPTSLETSPPTSACTLRLETIDKCYLNTGSRRAAQKSMGGIIVSKPDLESLKTLKTIPDHHKTHPIIVITREPRGKGINSMRYIKEALEGDE